MSREQFLIDSDIVIWFLKGREKEISLLNKLSSQGNLVVSVVTLTEVRAGLKETKEAKRILRKLQELFIPLLLDSDTAILAGAFRQKHRLHIADMLIAATAVVSGSRLVTYNKRHFPMKEVKLYKF